ncbi:MAG: OmpA family protein [Paludibacteraceae bacterium]|nr:OmpA family protein [Paludibacteraceae bacterium]
MKRILLPLALLAASLSVFAAIDSKFNEEKYEFKSLESNTSDPEQYLSKFMDKSLIFIKNGEVYVGSVDTAITSIDSIQKSKELTDLGIHGTVACDNSKKKIYFSLKESDSKEWLYESTFDGKSWSKPKRLEIEGLGITRGRSYFLANAGWNYVTEPKIIMLNPSIAKDGQRIYFTSADIEGGQGGKDIWWIEPKDDKVWKYPVNAGVTINSEADEDFAFVENDEILYVTSKKDSAVNSIFKADANGAVWAMAEKMEAPYNTQSEDCNIVVMDGTPFLVSNRGGNDDIWAWVKLPEPEPEPEIIIPELEPIVITFPWAFYLFDFDKSNLTERFLREIDAMVEAMAQLPSGTKFIIEGHTDQRGSDAYNDKLSLERANTVRDKLIEKGINPDILVAKGYGKRRPVIANPQNEEEFYQNRRVVVDILKEGAEESK